jgi:hypothetical protein
LRPHYGQSDGSEGAGPAEDVFIEAFVRVRGRYSNAEWSVLSPREIAEAVHREIGIIDAERQPNASATDYRTFHALGLRSWPAVVSSAHGPDRRA